MGHLIHDKGEKYGLGIPLEVMAFNKKLILQLYN